MWARREFQQSTTTLGFIGAEKSVVVLVAEVLVAEVLVAEEVVAEEVVAEEVVVEEVVAEEVVAEEVVAEEVVAEEVVAEEVVAEEVVAEEVVTWCPLVSSAQPFHTFAGRKTETHLYLNRYLAALRLSHQRQAFLHVF